jgi:hypothetical protein
LEDDDRKVKDLNMAIITANNHYAGFGPMTVKLFAEMMNLKDHIRPFPILDYKIPFHEISTSEKKITEYTNNDIQSQDKLIFLNSSNNIT